MLKKVSKYLTEILVIFLGVMMAFIAENWRENLQDQEDFRTIMNEIRTDIKLDSIELQGDKRRIIRQIDCIDQLLNRTLTILDLPRGGRPNLTCLDVIMWYDWPDYVTTGYHQLENSKIVPAGYNDELMTGIYEYYQWIDYHYLLVDPAIDDTQELQRYLIRNGFNPIEKEDLSDKEIDAFLRLLEDPQFIAQLNYLKYNRREELRIYQAMESKSKAILEMFRNSPRK